MKKKKQDFVTVDKELISGTVEVGQIYGLEVIEVGKRVTLRLKRLQELSEENKAREIKFADIFAQGVDSLILKHNTMINGILFSQGSMINREELLGGINFWMYLNRNLSVVKSRDYWKLVGIYKE